MNPSENPMPPTKIQNPTRRKFLRTAPVAAAAGFALATPSLHAEPAPAGMHTHPAPFQHITAAQLAHDIHTTEAHPGNINLVEEKGTSFSMVLTTEKHKAAPGFEAHAHRDHIFQILEGSTEFEIGGTPKGGHMIAPGEWRGPESIGATRLTLHKGDTLVIPRGTPHKRTTPGSVTFTLISPECSTIS
jgi:mannose-6-phosphate isomerase-like protein (cupin superfamily)